MAFFRKRAERSEARWLNDLSFEPEGLLSETILARLGIEEGLLSRDALARAGLIPLPFVHDEDFDPLDPTRVLRELKLQALEREPRVLYLRLGLRTMSDVYQIAPDQVAALGEYLARDYEADVTSVLALSDLSMLFINTAEDVGLLAVAPYLLDRFPEAEAIVDRYRQRFDDLRSTRDPLLADFDPF